MTEELKPIKKTSAWKDEQRVVPMTSSPPDGYVRNPALRTQPNDPCLCGSGRKWKKCCMSHQPLYISKADAKDMLLFLEGKDPRTYVETPDDKPLLKLVDEDFVVGAVFDVETRPSELTGFSWWATLSYKDHKFEEMLPVNLPALTEEERAKYAEAAGLKMRLKLKAIMEAEDAQCP